MPEVSIGEITMMYFTWDWLTICTTKVCCVWPIKWGFWLGGRFAGSSFCLFLR